MDPGFSARDARRLARAARTLRGGGWRFAGRCGWFGVIGGVLFALVLRAMSDCFDCAPLPAAGDALTLDALATRLAGVIGRFAALAAVSAAMFGGGLALFGWRTWPMIQWNYETLAARAGLIEPGPEDR